MNGFAAQINRNPVLQHPDCQHCLGRGCLCMGGVPAQGHIPHRGDLAKERSHSHSFPVPLQIAPAEGPDASERMVIITGPPEAQFKVRWPQSGRLAWGHG